MFKKILSLFLTVILSVLVVGCNKKPKTETTETETYTLINNLYYGKTYRQNLDITIPKNPTKNGVILMIHGGGWVAGEKDAYLESMKAYAEKGYVSCATNYRYLSKKINCEDILNDLNSAVKLIKETLYTYGINAEKLVLTGGSAGGHLSLLYGYKYAETSPIKPTFIFSLSGPTNLNDENYFNSTKYIDTYLKWFSWLTNYKITLNNYQTEKVINLLNSVSPIYYANENSPVTVLIHGNSDDVVPYTNATLLYSKLQNLSVKCEIFTLNNTGHGEIYDKENYNLAVNKINEYLELYL